MGFISSLRSRGSQRPVLRLTQNEAVNVRLTQNEAVIFQGPPEMFFIIPPPLINLHPCFRPASRPAVCLTQNEAVNSRLTQNKAVAFTGTAQNVFYYSTTLY